jgi:hypothetical protein
VVPPRNGRQQNHADDLRGAVHFARPMLLSRLIALFAIYLIAVDTRPPCGKTIFNS